MQCLDTLMIDTKLPSPGMSWKGPNWTMWLHCHTVGKSCIWTICTAMSRLWRHWFEILVVSNPSKRSKAHEKNFHANSDSANARYWSAPAAFGSYLSVHLSILKLKGTHSASIPTNPMVEHLQVFTSPRKKMNKKYHTPYGCGTHTYFSQDLEKQNLQLQFSEFFTPPKSVEHHETVTFFGYQVTSTRRPMNRHKARVVVTCSSSDRSFLWWI